MQEDQGYVDSGCSKHMTSNMSYLSDFKELDGGYVTFGGGTNGGRITGKGSLKTDKLDFEDVYFVKELKFNLLSVSHMCDKKNSVLFTDTGCFVLSPDFKESNTKPPVSPSLMHTKYGLVVTDDYSKYNWVLFLTSKDETTGILKKFITEIENLVDRKLREFSVARTPQQDGVAERKNRTLIEAARTMLADSKGRTPALSFMRPFGCHVTILNTLDHLGKFDGKANEGYFVGYSMNSKAFRVYNIRTKRVEENLHIRFLEDKPSIVRKIVLLQLSDDAGSPSSGDDGKKLDGVLDKESGASNELNSAFENLNTEYPNDLKMPGLETITTNDDSEEGADFTNLESSIHVSPTPTTRTYKNHPLKSKLKPTNKQGFISAVYDGKTHEDLYTYLFSCFLSQIEAITIVKALSDPAWVEAMQEELLQFKLQKMDVKSAFLYGRIEEEVYVCQPSRFEDPDPPAKLLDESQVLLKVPRNNNMYSFDLKNVVPVGGIENQMNHKVKIIRCDNGTKFKNSIMNEFCEIKGIRREFSIARTPQQNVVAERKNRTLIEAVRTMLANSKLPTTFWGEAVNTACYVQNRMLVIKPHNKTPYCLKLHETMWVSCYNPKYLRSPRVRAFLVGQAHPILKSFPKPLSVQLLKDREKVVASAFLVGESSPNPTSLNSRRRNRRRSKQHFILEESPIDTMADQRTMAELLRAPTEGYAEAIVVPPILVEFFDLKHSLINMITSNQFFRLEKDNPHDHIRWFNKITTTIKYMDVPNSAIKLMLFLFSVAGAARRWLKKEPSCSILTWEDLVSKFINEFFPPSRTKNLCNEISNFQQRFDESFHEAWDRYKDLLHACPHHGFTEFYQLDTFYNALNPADQDSLNSTTCGNLLERHTQDVLTIIENKSKIAKLTHAVNQQTIDVTTAMTAILKQFQATPPPASVKANMMASFFQMNTASTSSSGPLPSNTIANPKSELKAITTRSGLVLDRPSVPMPPPFINLEEDERVEETLTDPKLDEYTIKVPPPLVQKAKPTSQRNYVKMLKALLSNKEELLELANTPLNEIAQRFTRAYFHRMTLELANRAICTPAGIARDVFVPVEKFTFPADFVIFDYESDPRVSIISGRPFLRTARALIDVHREEMILQSINMINIYDDSCEDYLEDLFATNHVSGNLTFSSHADLTSPEVKDDIFDPEGDIVLIEKLINLDSTEDLRPPHNINPLSGCTTSSSPDHLLEEEMAYLLNHDLTKEIDSILEDSVDEDNLVDPNDDLVDTILEMFTDKHTLDYSSPPIYDDFDDDLVDLESDNEYVYDDPFDSKEDKINESKLFIDELDPSRSNYFLPSPEYDSFLFEDFSEVGALPSTNNEDKVFNPCILIYENPSEVTVQVTPYKNVKKISNASLILKEFDPPLYKLPFHKEVPWSKTLFLFSSKNEEKVFKPEILTSKGVHTSLLPELSHRGPKVFKVIKIFESPMEIFPCSYGEDIRILDVLCLHFYPSCMNQFEDRVKLSDLKQALRGWQPILFLI
nr:reverse transcriptase domain-containing protein [Tanacetum cinerariifolium]